MRNRVAGADRQRPAPVEPVEWAVSLSGGHGKLLTVVPVNGGASSLAMKPPPRVTARRLTPWRGDDAGSCVESTPAQALSRRAVQAGRRAVSNR